MAEVVTTVKGDGAAPWIVVHAETPAECERILTEALGGLLQTASEASQLLTASVVASKGVGQQAAPQGGNDWGPPQQPAQAQWQNQVPTGGGWQNQQGGGFVGSPNPEGKRCTLCQSVLVGKQPKVKKMWSCPNQRAQGDGHTVEWINS